MSVGELTRAVPENGPFSIVNCGWGERLHSGQFISQVSSFVRLYPHCTQAGRKAGQRYRFQYVFAGEYIFCLKPGGDWLALYYRLHIFSGEKWRINRTGMPIVHIIGGQVAGVRQFRSNAVADCRETE